MLIKLCALALIKFGEYCERKAYELDLVRDVISDYDPKTGEERIWHVYDKGQTSGDDYPRPPRDAKEAKNLGRKERTKRE